MILSLAFPGFGAGPRNLASFFVVLLRFFVRDVLVAIPVTTCLHNYLRQYCTDMIFKVVQLPVQSTVIYSFEAI